MRTARKVDKIMGKIKALVVLPTDETHRERLVSALPEYEFTFKSGSELVKEDFEGVRAVLGNPPPELIKHASDLELFQLGSAGTNGYEEIFDRGAVICNATGAFGLSISEYMLGTVLYFYRKLNLYHDNSRGSLWKREGTVRSIYGSRVLVVGLGDIGGEFAKRMKAMGAYTVGVRRKGTDKPDYLDELVMTADLDKQLPLADIVAISVPGVKETENMFDAARLGSMKDDSILINVGRGLVVDTEALCALLDTGKFGGVALDVTAPEPLPADHRLWNYKNVLITPHVSGGYHLAETYERVFGIACRNLKAFAQGLPLENLVDTQTGYRKL